MNRRGFLGLLGAAAVTAALPAAAPLRIDRETGIRMRFVFSSKRGASRIDVLYGFQAQYADCACVICG